MGNKMINGKRILNEPLSRIVSGVEGRRLGVNYVLARGLEELEVGLENVEFNEYTVNWFLNFEELLFKYEQLLDEIKVIGSERDNGIVSEKDKWLVSSYYQNQFEELACELNRVLDLKHEIENTLRKSCLNGDNKDYNENNDRVRRIEDSYEGSILEIDAWTM